MNITNLSSAHRYNTVGENEACLIEARSLFDRSYEASKGLS